MSAEGIDKLRQQLTDQYVVVQGNRPELVRFQGQTGQVKTVNCNGRALVEFDGFGNRGWYDIAPDYLRIVPKPEPKLPEKPPAKAAAKPVAAKPAPQAATGAGPSPAAESPAAPPPAAETPKVKSDGASN
jgi:hypothetical protein